MGSFSTPRIAIIGAGLAGIAAARELTSLGDVRVFEKSRGPGGRMSSRRADPFQFNHGAQFFTARSKAFNSLIEQAEQLGVVSQWQPKLVTLDPNAESFKRSWFEPHFVPNNGMNALAKFLGAELNLSTRCEITQLIRKDNCWTLIEANGAQYGPFDWVLSSAPAAQTMTLLPPTFSGFSALNSVKFSSCFALMLGFTQTVDFGFEAAVIKNSSLSWATTAVNSGRSTLLAHSDNSWADENLEANSEWVQQKLLSELSRVAPKQLPAAAHVALHRWRFARCESPLTETHLLDKELGLGVCGDWCGGNRVEDAFTSGMSLAKQLKTNPMRK